VCRLNIKELEMPSFKVSIDCDEFCTSSSFFWFNALLVAQNKHRQVSSQIFLSPAFFFSALKISPSRFLALSLYLTVWSLSCSCSLALTLACARALFRATTWKCANPCNEHIQVHWNLPPTHNLSQRVPSIQRFGVPTKYTYRHSNISRTYKLYSEGSVS